MFFFERVCNLSRIFLERFGRSERSVGGIVAMRHVARARHDKGRVPCPQFPKGGVYRVFYRFLNHTQRVAEVRPYKKKDRPHYWSRLVDRKYYVDLERGLLLLLAAPALLLPAAARGAAHRLRRMTSIAVSFLLRFQFLPSEPGLGCRFLASKVLREWCNID